MKMILRKIFRCSESKFLWLRSLSNSFSNNEEKYELMYSFPYARVGAVVNRLKLVQSAMSGLAFPVTAALELQSIAPVGSTVACGVTCLAFNGAFYSVGQLFYRLVGKAYIDKKRKKVKISHIGFFGKRINIELPIEDVEGLENAGLFYSKLHLKNFNSLPYVKIQEKYFDYCNVELARRAFGESFMR